MYNYFAVISVEKYRFIMEISKRQLERFPIYLRYLLVLQDTGVKKVSAPFIAKALHLSEEQVRKDLQVVSSSEGKPKSGRDVHELIHDIKNFIGYDGASKAVIVGCGNLGRAFLNYKGFEKYGLDIIAGFDVDKNIIGTQINHKHVYDMKDIENTLPLLNAKIAILTVPASIANVAAKKLVKSGIKGIWNFVPIQLEVSDSIVVENVNLASSLAILSHKLNKGE